MPVRIFITLIKIYQKYVSPFFGNHCRFYPSCSQYAILSLTKDGLLKGTFKTTWRLLRCNPLTRGGVDFP
ncbi:MAG: membrane protein insertion efficiency factor YidD [Candidatus Latescibacteria bacterium]|nr:membrane protein insertion efficiency factor YidD [Candidatus Latescibacterota bacterium]